MRRPHARTCAHSWTQNACERMERHERVKTANYAQPDTSSGSCLVAFQRARAHAEKRRGCYSVVLVLFRAESLVILFCSSQSDSNRQNSPRPRHCNRIGCIKSYTKPPPSGFSEPLRGSAPLRSACSGLMIFSNQSGKFGLRRTMAA